MTAFTDALLQATPAIPGLDRSIVIPPRRLHLTLGVLSLDAQNPSSPSRSPSGVESSSAGQPRTPPAARATGRPRTLEAARALLRDIRPRILDILAGVPLRVQLDSMDIMKPERGDLERAHVMWIGPSHEGEGARRLKVVAQFVHDTFKKEGLLVDEGRPLKLHCTVLNTIYRKPRSRNRVPFSYAAVLSSAALEAMALRSTEPATEEVQAQLQGHRLPRARAVELGEWTVDEVQLCEMGSWGPEGEYVCVGRCPLV
ncbi:hypothetical protein OBBRIDRAFT_799527 [Obba rivulosa]|uniref:A-kinase anchor protein 7-like phosphoesterase domain-containing protein n=1 Tax=Obba rivulosa TaxID=1052685 RepID=A0A8E2AG87_9APHY|nr:hypothetical protein OBBRIDRAFT_799527 [Obba rivulosa]